MPVRLDDGRILRTLADVRGLLLSLPPLRQANVTWQTAGALLLDAAHGGRYVDLRELTTQLSQAFKSEHLN